MHKHSESRLLRLTYKTCKYFLLFLLGISIVSLLSLVLGSTQTAALLLTFFSPWICRAAILLFCFWGVTVVVESLR